MKSARISIFTVLVLSISLFFFSCDEGGNGTDSTNSAPIISDITANPASGLVDLEETSTLTVTASDPDGDELEYNWGDATTAGDFDTTGGATVVWTAPDEALPSTVIVWVSDGVVSVDTSYTFDYSAFAPGAPVIDSVYATPAHIYVATAGTPDQWFLELFAEIADGSALSHVIRVTAEPPSGQIFNLCDNGVGPDPVADDYEFNGFPGSTTKLDTGWVNFSALNQYYEEAVDSFFIDQLCDSLPTVVAPDSVVGDIYCYNTGTPQFVWNTFSGAENYQISLSRMDYTYIWQPTEAISDTTKLYNYDGSATLIQLEINTDYIFHLRVDKGNSWAKREQIIRRIVQ